MLFHHSTGDEMVVKVGENKWQGSEELVYEELEGLGCPGEAKRHEQIFKQTKGGDNHGFLDVLGGHGYLWYPLIRRMTEKTVQSCNFHDRSCMEGRGYMSGTVQALRWR